MVLILTPSTNPVIKETIVRHFNAKPLFGVEFWPVSFISYPNVPLLANNSFEVKTKKGIRLYIISAGYGELSIEYAIREYVRLLLKEDPIPRIYFINVCLPTKQSGLKLGDVVIPASSEGGIIAKLYQRKMGRQVCRFDLKLMNDFARYAATLKIHACCGRLYSPEDGAEFDWADFYEKSGDEHGYIAMEHESALVAAMGNYYDIPTVASLCVKDVGEPDNRYVIKKPKRKTDYDIIDFKLRIDILRLQLKLIELSLTKN